MDLPANSPPAPVALLVDGENLSKELAPDILREIDRFGKPRVRRVYGNMNAVSGWEDHGFRLCPTRPGKNAADMLLCVEAMALALRDGFGTLVIASSDRDFSYLAEQLREMGKRVIGVGRQTAPTSFREACSVFVPIGAPTTQPPVSEKKPSGIAAHLTDAIRREGSAGLLISTLGAKAINGGFKVSETKEKTWRKWLEMRGNLFVLDPKGPNARVRLRV